MKVYHFAPCVVRLKRITILAHGRPLLLPGGLPAVLLISQEGRKAAAALPGPLVIYQSDLSSGPADPGPWKAPAAAW